MPQPESTAEARGAGASIQQHFWNSQVLALCQAGRDGQPLASTPAFRELAGWKEGSAAAPEIAEVIHPEDRVEFRQFFRRHFNSPQELHKGVFRLVSAEGRIAPVEVHIEPVRENGEVRSVVLVFQEFNPAHFLSEDQVDELEKFLVTASGVIESLLDAVLIVSVEGRIVQANESLLELLGRRRFEVVGMPVGSLFTTDPLEVAKFSARFARILKFGKVRDVDVKILAKQGEEIPISLSGSVIRSGQNELLGVVAVLRDQRQNKLMRELSRKNRELEKAYDELKQVDGMKDDLLSLVGHELRSPLSNIIGYSEFLQDDSLSRAETHEFSRIIHDEAQRLARLVNDILDLSRMERGKMVYHYVSYSLNRVVEGAVQACSGDASAKRQPLLVELDETLPELEFDPDRIEQVVVNMVSNAIKYSPEDTRIRVRSRAIPGGARVEVEDQGYGIPSDQAHKVFSKFEQIEGRREHTKGAGLGMPIAKGIIEDGHGGTMGFTSPGPGLGSIFYFILPLSKRREEG